MRHTRAPIETAADPLLDLGFVEDARRYMRPPPLRLRRSLWMFDAFVEFCISLCSACCCCVGLAGLFACGLVVVPMGVFTPEPPLPMRSRQQHDTPGPSTVVLPRAEPVALLYRDLEEEKELFERLAAARAAARELVLLTSDVLLCLSVG